MILNYFFTIFVSIIVTIKTRTMKSKFLKRQAETMYKPTNPCPVELKFNGGRKGGFFQTYDPTIEDKAERKSKLKQKKIKLVILGMLKKIGGVAKTKTEINISSSNYFLDYKTDHIDLYYNGDHVAGGVYSEIAAKKDELKAKVSNYFFCYSPTLKQCVIFVVKGGQKSALNNLFKANGGSYGQCPYIEVTCGELEQGESFDFYHLDAKALDTSTLSDEDITIIDQVGESVEEFIEYARKVDPQAEADENAPEPELDDPEDIEEEEDFLEDAPNTL